MNRRAWNILAVLALILCLPLGASAQKTVCVEGKEVAFEPPEGWYVIVPGEPAEAAALAALGMTQAEADEMLAALGFAAYLFDSDWSHAIHVFAQGVADIRDFGPMTREELAVYLARELGETDYADILEAGESKWLFQETRDLEDADFPVYRKDYRTVCQGVSCLVSYSAYGKPFTGAEARQGESFVGSLTFAPALGRGERKRATRLESGKQAAQADSERRVTLENPALSLWVGTDCWVLAAGQPYEGSDWEALGFTQAECEETQAQLLASYTYLSIIPCIIPSDGVNEMTLTAVPGAICNDFSEMSEAVLDFLAQGMMTQADATQELGISEYTYEKLVKAGGTQWILLNGRRDNLEIPGYFRQYCTVYQGQNVSLTYNAYGAPLTQAEEALHDQVLQSMDLYALTSPVSTPAPAAELMGERVSYVNEADEIALSFQLPQGFEERPLIKERAYVRAKYACKGTPQGFILGYGDLYKELGDLASLVSRDQVDTRMLLDEMGSNPEELLRDWLALELQPETAEVYSAGGAEWIGGHVSTTEKVLGIHYTLRQYAYIGITNGIMLTLQFFDMTQEEAHLILDSLRFEELPV